MESDERAAASRNAAAFKLSTLETVGADPKMKPIDHSLLAAYMRFMKWPARTAYLSNLKARIMTGMSAQSTISASRARLIEMGYLKVVMTKLNGAVIYELDNSRAEIVADHIAIAEETLREWDARRKTDDRKRRARVMKSVTPNRPEGNENQQDRVTKINDNSLDANLGVRAPKRDPSVFNAYAAASRGEKPMPASIGHAAGGIAARLRRMKAE